jgi:transcriptional regulator with XRE-family HTH domain
MEDQVVLPLSGGSQDKVAISRNTPQAGPDDATTGPVGPGLATRLRHAVRGAGGNQVVADRAGVPLATVNNYVRGRNGMKIEALSALATACGVSLDWLVVGAGPAATPAPGASAPGLAEPVADLLAPPMMAVDVRMLAKAIEVVEAVAGVTAFREDPKGLARRIASAYAVLMQPETARDGGGD